MSGCVRVGMRSRQHQHEARLVTQSCSYANKGLTALEMHGELQGICLGAKGDPLGIHGGSAPKSGDPGMSRLLAHEF